MKIGDKVVCVNNANMGTSYKEILPVVGEIYTIRSLGKFHGLSTCYLKEIVNKPYDYWDGFGEADFYLWRFRPINPLFGEETAERIEKEMSKVVKELDEQAEKYFANK